MIDIEYLILLVDEKENQEQEIDMELERKIEEMKSMMESKKYLPQSNYSQRVSINYEFLNSL